MKTLAQRIPARRSVRQNPGMAHTTGRDRSQTLLLPEPLDDYIRQDKGGRWHLVLSPRRRSPAHIICEAGCQTIEYSAAARYSAQIFLHGEPDTELDVEGSGQQAHQIRVLFR